MNPLNNKALGVLLATQILGRAREPRELLRSSRTERVRVIVDPNEIRKTAITQRRK